MGCSGGGQALYVVGLGRVLSCAAWTRQSPFGGRQPPVLGLVCVLGPLYLIVEHITRNIVMCLTLGYQVNCCSCVTVVGETDR